MSAPKNGRSRKLAAACIGLVTALLAIGIVMVLSATSVASLKVGRSPYDGGLRHGAHIGIGLTLMLILSRLPTSRIRRYAWPALLIGLTLQLMVHSPLGYEVSGNRNWLRVGPLNGQPAELMKVVLLVWVSAVLASKSRLLHRWTHAVIPVLPIVAISMFINILGGDLGTLTIIAAIVFGCLYLSPIRGRVLSMIALIAGAGILLMAAIKPNRVMRVAHFFEVDCATATPEQYYGLCWQSLQGFYALARGGLMGEGLGNSAAKWGWLPEVDNDYIFAIVGEELGLVGTVLVLALFAMLIFVLFIVSRHCSDLFSSTVAGGLAIWISAQVAVNVAVVLGFIPVLGVPLPLMSSGGTAMIAVLMAMGVVLASLREQQWATRGPARDTRVRRLRHRMESSLHIT